MIANLAPLEQVADEFGCIQKPLSGDTYSIPPNYLPQCVLCKRSPKPPWRFCCTYVMWYDPKKTECHKRLLNVLFRWSHWPKNYDYDIILRAYDDLDFWVCPECHTDYVLQLKEVYGDWMFPNSAPYLDYKASLIKDPKGE